METKIIKADQRNLMRGAEFKGYHIFSNGQKGTVRPDRFGAVYVFNDDTMFPNAYLGLHPHANVEVITVMVDGEESHEDNLGYHQEIKEGAVQLISSGSGIRHAGGNKSATKDARHFQIWISPNNLNTIPSVQLQQFDLQAQKNVWISLISPDGSNNSLTIKQNAWMLEGMFEKGTTAYQLQHQENGAMIYLLKGRIKVGEVIANQEDTLFVTGTEKIEITIEEDASLILIETPI